MNTTLTPGTYDINPDCTAIVAHGQVFVTLKQKRPSFTRCRDCKHFTEGYSQYNQYVLSNICLMRPKENKSYHGKPCSRIKRYYAANPLGKACGHFKPKDHNTEHNAKF